MMVSAPEVGTEFPPFSHRVDPVKATEFATAIDDSLRRLPSGAWEVPIGMLFFVPIQDSGLIFRSFGADWTDVLFGGIALTFDRPVETGEELHGRTVVTSSRERGEGSARSLLVDLTTSYKGAEGGCVMTEVSTIVIRRPPRDRPGELPPAPLNPEPAAGAWVHRVEVSRLKIAYMAISIEDPNPIHVEDEIALRAGFPGAIAHGTFPIGALGAAVAASCGPGRLRRLEVRLIAPVYPGSEVVAQVRLDGESYLLEAHAGGRLVAKGSAQIAQ